MAAERLAGAGLAVHVYDRMPSVGRKFLLAGRGGLNLTHAEPAGPFLQRYGPAAAALRPALEAFSPDALRAWCAALGEDTFVGSSFRVFPRSFKATPLLRAWLRRLAAQGVVVHIRHDWQGFADDGALLFAGQPPMRPAATILALGGASWPRLGADGSWAPVLRAAGIAVTPLRADNCGVLCRWSDVVRTRFAGQPLKRIAATVGHHTVRGEAVITADGLEGGVIYALGRAIREALEREGTAQLILDLRPDLTAEQLSQRTAGRGQSLANALRKAGLTPAAAALVREAAGPGDLATRIKRVPLTIEGTVGLNRAISTAGGVALAGIDPSLMLCARPGVFVAGEMLDWDAPTGGYLLQAAFSTGRYAAEGVLRWLASRQGATTLRYGPERLLGRDGL